MKYFTPDLITAYGSDDPTIYKDAEQRWDLACEQHTRYLDSVRHLMPAGVRTLDEKFTLHDAVIRGMGDDGNRLFFLLLELEHPPRTLVTLNYQLVASPTIQHDCLPVEFRTPDNYVTWQYDEIEKVQDQPLLWEQRILLSNGWEISLSFTDVDVQEMSALLSPTTSVNPSLTNLSPLFSSEQR